MSFRIKIIKVAEAGDVGKMAIGGFNNYTMKDAEIIENYFYNCMPTNCVGILTMVRHPIHPWVIKGSPDGHAFKKAWVVEIVT